MNPKSEEFIQEIIDNIQPGSFRHDVLETSRRFKNNWYEMGRKLTQVANQNLFEEWGYKSFQDYCRLEIRIRNSTAMKLTNAFFFLQNETKGSDWSEKETEIPDFDSVRILQKAKQNELWTPELYDDFKQTALSGPVPAKTLNKKYNEIQQSLTGEEEPETDWKKPLFSARKLREFLERNHAKNSWLEVLKEIEIHLSQKEAARKEKEGAYA